MSSVIKEEAQCPKCKGWFPVEWQIPGATLGIPIENYLFASPWWKGSGDCPGCGATVLVETECLFGSKKHEKNKK